MSEPDGSPKRFVIYRGTQMIEGWPDKITEAQNITHYDIGGEDFERVRYGNELDDWGANERPCHDCRVLKGEYHVVSCDVERCRSVVDRSISCDCLDELMTIRLSVPKSNGLTLFLCSKAAVRHRLERVGSPRAHDSKWELL
jgi:hypothetical protein